MELSIIAGGHLRPDPVFVHVKRVRQYGIHGRKIIRSLSGIPVPFQQPPFRLIHIIEKVSAVPYHLPFISRPGIPFFQYIVHQFPAILFIPYRQVHISVFRIVRLSLDKLITETMDGLYRNPLSFFSHIFLYPMLHFPACLIGECEAENFLRSCHALLHQPGYTSRQSPCFSCSCRCGKQNMMCHVLCHHPLCIIQNIHMSPPPLHHSIPTLPPIRAKMVHINKTDFSQEVISCNRYGKKRYSARLY